MFDNIGGKLKALSKFVCYVGIICSIIGAIALWMSNSRYNPTILAGFILLIFGSLSSWIGSWVTYAIGEAAENSAALRTEVYELRQQVTALNNTLYSAPAGKHQSSAGKTAVPSSIGSNSKLDLLSATRSSGSSNGWTCPYCSAHNSNQSQYCKDCGKYR